MTAIVMLYSALICFQGHCYHALVGRSTPIGTFSVVHKLTRSPGYGGDILVFDELPDKVYAVHRVWLLQPEQHRAERLDSDNPAMRRNVTMGCVNVSPNVYEQLENSLTRLEIVRK